MAQLVFPLLQQWMHALLGIEVTKRGYEFALIGNTYKGGAEFWGLGIVGIEIRGVALGRMALVTKEVLMATICKILGGLLFCVLGLSNAALANDPASADDHTGVGPCEKRDGQAALKAEQDQRKDVQMIQGEVLRVEGHTYFVKLQDGKEVNLQTDQTTEKPDINQGDHIEAGVNDQNHALWIRSGKSTDRRNEHAAADCTVN